jgi:hypothetical protein
MLRFNSTFAAEGLKRLAAAAIEYWFLDIQRVYFSQSGGSFVLLARFHTLRNRNCRGGIQRNLLCSANTGRIFGGNPATGFYQTLNRH